MSSSWFESASTDELWLLDSDPSTKPHISMADNHEDSAQFVSKPCSDVHRVRKHDLHSKWKQGKTLTRYHAVVTVAPTPAGMPLQAEQTQIDNPHSKAVKVTIVARMSVVFNCMTSLLTDIILLTKSELQSHHSSHHNLLPSSSGPGVCHA